MRWWDSLYLNEGFARWCEYYFASLLFPQWGLQQQFVSEIVESAMQTDALLHSHAIEVAVNTPEEINEVFDQITSVHTHRQAEKHACAHAQQ